MWWCCCGAWLCCFLAGPIAAFFPLPLRPGNELEAAADAGTVEAEPTPAGRPAALLLLLLMALLDTKIVDGELVPSAFRPLAAVAVTITAAAAGWAVGLPAAAGAAAAPAAAWPFFLAFVPFVPFKTTFVGGSGHKDCCLAGALAAVPVPLAAVVSDEWLVGWAAEAAGLGPEPCCGCCWFTFPLPLPLPDTAAAANEPLDRDRDGWGTDSEAEAPAAGGCNACAAPRSLGNPDVPAAFAVAAGGCAAPEDEEEHDCPPCACACELPSCAAGSRTGPWPGAPTEDARPAPGVLLDVGYNKAARRDADPLRAGPCAPSAAPGLAPPPPLLLLGLLLLLPLLRLAAPCPGDECCCCCCCKLFGTAPAAAPPPPPGCRCLPAPAAVPWRPRGGSRSGPTPLPPPPPPPPPAAASRPLAEAGAAVAAGSCAPIARDSRHARAVIPAANANARSTTGSGADVRHMYDEVKLYRGGALNSSAAAKVAYPAVRRGRRAAWEEVENMRMADSATAR